MSRSLRAAPVPILALGLVFSLGCFGDVELEACTLSETYCDAAETTVPANSVGATAGLTGTSGAAESGGRDHGGRDGRGDRDDGDDRDDRDDGDDRRHRRHRRGAGRCAAVDRRAGL